MPKPTTGHNSIAKEKLKSFVERIVRLEGEKKGTSVDIRDVYAEAKGVGYDTKALRVIVRMTIQDEEKAEERRLHEAVVGAYARVLGVQQSFDFDTEVDDAFAEVEGAT